MHHKKLSYLLLCYCCLAIQLQAQEIYTASDKWGMQKGQCIAVIENNQIFKSDGAFCTQGQCVYIIEGQKVFKSSGAFCTFRGDCLFINDRGYLYQSADVWGNYTDNLLLIKQGNLIFEGGNGVGQNRCLYIIEDNKVFNSLNGSTHMKDDCLLILEGYVSDVMLLAVLARRF